ncbi:MAG: response regulator transcription factor [Clostridia bacterium]|nr:response regulator transcription factor [Clostridia bacterium]
MIYLVEDDDNIRKLVSYALTKEGYEVKGFEQPHSFWEELKTNLPELIILDIMLPEEDGLSILKKIRKNERTEDLPVIMLTAKDSEFDKVTGLDSGADDYISKPFGMTELISRVKALLRRVYKNTEKTIYSLDSLYVDPQKHIIKVSGQEIALSYKEYSLLMVLLSAKGNVVSRDELLNKVWGEYYSESRTLDVHIRKLRIKLGSAGKLIQTVKNIGYKIGGTDND